MFGDQINCPVFTIGVSETALQNNMDSLKVFKKHTYCTSFDILSAGFHMISALHIGV